MQKVEIGLIKWSLVVLLIQFISTLNAQVHIEDNQNHDHHRNEIGLAMSPVYFVNEKEISFGLHAHYVHNLEDSDIAFAMHLEASYEFEVGDMHIGPLLEIAYDPEDYHISLGLHIGFGF